MQSTGLRAYHTGTTSVSRCCRRSFLRRAVPRNLTLLRFSATRRQRYAGFVVCTYPEPETEKERSPLDYPQEWVTPQPSRRPDIFPEFEKLETPLPKPLPGDPEQPDEEEEIEKDKEKPKPEPEEDPEKDPEKGPEKDPEEPELPDA